MLDRRQFLGGVGAASAALALRGCGAGAPSYGGFAMAIQTWTFRQFATEAMLDMVVRLGVNRLEMYDQHFNSSGTPDDIAAMRARLADLGIDTVTHGMDPFTDDAAANRRLFDFARAAGIKNFLADPPPAAFASLDALVAEYDVRIAIHNHGPGSQYNTPDDVLAAIAGHDARIGTCVDTGHYIRSGIDPVDAIRRLGARVYGVHLKDVGAADPAAPDVVLGTGLLDVAGVFAVLREVGFPADGSLSLEYEGSPDDPYADVAACLAAAAAAAG